MSSSIYHKLLSSPAVQTVCKQELIVAAVLKVLVLLTFSNILTVKAVMRTAAAQTDKLSKEAAKDLDQVQAATVIVENQIKVETVAELMNDVKG